ncbi:ATP-dependent RNA helicase HrpA [Pseudomarimonas salicorniae]|uniref:ATP-dependent RNA helicase HrpA n=1 Tax=Pseudomarimonas salicorniae TaxID=2933270 RepID=A0ABT0GH75_9GAMM|nr:ATP-dependent RNA helicase HrpA [Lysobacter sp. CAU 1642]MCK7593890.1 ATP-dependent RNA helicase HrpA [Lysobacter sp. CAU 1642]
MSPGSRPNLRGVATRDYGRLRRRASQLQQKPDAEAQARLLAEIEASKAAVAARAERLPTPAFPEDLPVSREAERIVELISKHQVLVIAGETGSGKTTQLPKLCLAAGRGAAGMIGCTQPRRIAARSVARRVAEELQVELGGVVGYQVRFTEQVREDTAIKFMTDGILLAEIQSDRFLSRYDTIILDEAHERSLNIDFLLGYLKGLLRKRRDLKLIVTSATIDTERFARHFDDAPVLSVEGRSYPVEVRYRPPHGGVAIEDESGEAVREARSPTEHIVATVDEITRGDRLGDILIFLPGEREIHELHRALEQRKYRETEVAPLYARLSARDQDRVFRPGPKRRIVLATNVAETSLTVPRIRYVIDPGTARVKRYSPRQKLDRLHIEPISRAAADQRKGRCGRISEGICYRLYDESDYQARPAFTDPEIRRAALAGVILRMLSLGLGQVDAFPFIDPPDPRAVAEGWQQLVELGAVDKERRLTPTGRQMARWPVDVKLSRMLIAAHEIGVLRELLVIAAFLSIQDPRERPADARGAADTAHAQFADAKSEFVGILNLWEAYRAQHEALTQSKLRDWCGKQFLSFLRMREWRELHRQLLLLAREAGWTQNEAAADYGALHRALIAGMPMQVGHKIEKGVFEAPRQRRFAIFPGSKLAKQPPNWLLSAVLLDTQRVYALTCARIEPEWVVEQAEHLVSRKHFDPHWSRAQGRVIGSEQISLFGLVLMPKRPVHYGGLYPDEAREIFVREGLLPGEINTRCGFVERNLKTLEKAREEEAKLRRAGLVADEDWQARWYLDRLPPEINSAGGLDTWYRKLPKAEQAALEWSVVDLMPGEGGEQDRFPKFLPLGEARLALSYRFEPGSEEDGVTVDVPLHLLNALDPVRLTWLVPGFAAERATELIRGLPKALRRNFVPAPDFAQAFFEAYPAPTADVFEGELARFLKRATGAEIGGADFSPEALPAHLRFRLCLLDRDGRRELAASRDLDSLRAQFGGKAEAAFAARVSRGMARDGLTDFPADPVPKQIKGEAGVPAFPTLVDRGDSVALEIRADRQEAEREHPEGVRRLLRLGLQDAVKQARKQLPVSPKLGLLYAAIESQERLRGDIVESAFLAVSNRPLGGIRDAEAFAALREEVRRGLFAAAMERLKLAEQILALYAELRPALKPPLVGFAKANYDDLSAQLESLVHPGFLRETPAERLQHFPRYLRAMQLRAERLARDPGRDQTRMLELLPFQQRLEAYAADRRPSAWWDLRWALEELRVSLFAQELGTAEPVSPKRLARLLEDLPAPT